MGEQNRRAVDIEPRPAAAKRPRTLPEGGPPDAPDRALTPDADERQTLRQAPAGASPGESAQDDSIG